jgi:uncharacterized protein YuzE
VSFDNGANVGYVNLGPHGVPVARTLVMDEDRPVLNVDVRDDGSPIGIEVFAPDAETKSAMRNWRAAV